VWAQCTTAEAGRVIVLHPHLRQLVAARAQAETGAFDTSTRGCDRWWNAAWPGSPGGPTASCTTGAWSATSSGGPIAVRPSTCSRLITLGLVAGGVGDLGHRLT
jgi:hypothetical protein